MLKRFTLPTFVLFAVLLVTFGYTNPDVTQLTPSQLLTKACGGTVLGLNSPPEFIPELRVAAANALAELVKDARSQNAPIEIDLASTWESVAGQGPNAECRAIGQILLSQIYLDPTRLDNPYGDEESGLADLISSVNSPPQDFSIELTKARIEALVIVCRRSLFGGTPSEVVSRLESIANGATQLILCGSRQLNLDGSNEGVQGVISNALKGAYLSQLGPIALSADERNPTDRANSVCEELLKRIEDESATSNYRLAAAEAYLQGNTNSRLPSEFSYDCASDSELTTFVKGGGVFADAGLDLLAKSFASNGISGAELEVIAASGGSVQVQLAAALALGIRWTSDVSVNGSTGNVFANGRDAILATTNLTGNPIALAYSIPIAQAWAGRSMDTAGHCVQVGGLADCILTQQSASQTRLTSLKSNRLQSQFAAQEDEQTNFKIITDEEIRNFVNLNEGAEGFDVRPLSSAQSGGTITYGAAGSFTTGLALGRFDGDSFGWTSAYVHESLLETGFSGEIEPALAEFFEISEDEAHVIFRVRAGVKWSDGVSFTASDVLFSASAAFQCNRSPDNSSEGSSLRPFFDSEVVSAASSALDGSCTGLPVILGNTSFIASGPNGKLESSPLGNDEIFGSRIIPASSPLAIGQPGNNVIASQLLESIVAGDDEIIEVGSNEIAIVWRDTKEDAERLGQNHKFCCLPQHILASSLDEALTAGNPQILLDRWNLEELKELPESFVGTGPFILRKFDKRPGGEIIYTRNAVYWKVDETGQRLPKLDGLHAIDFTDLDDARLNAHLNGQLDIYAPNFGEMALLQREAEEHGIENYMSDQPTTEGYSFFFFNSDIHLFDPNKEALSIAFRNPEVRRALSQVLDRVRHSEEFNQGEQAATFVGSRPKPRDIVAPTCPVSLSFDELQNFCDAYEVVESQVEFNLGSAGMRLDRIGLKDLDGDGIRDIPEGFGQILPGQNGLLDTEPVGDDFILAGLEYSGLGLSDRDGDGSLDPDPGIIQPGPNGVLDTMPTADDTVEITSMSGNLSFRVAFAFDIPFDHIVRKNFREPGRSIGIDADLMFVTQLFQRVLSNPPTVEGAFLGFGRPNLAESLATVWGSCGPLHLHKRSECQNRAKREPYQVRIDEIQQLANMANDEFTLSQLHAELQLLQAANMPWMFSQSGRGVGSVSRNGTNAAAAAQFDTHIKHPEILFRLDLE
jgi:ABC-type transport system substrate-binding protein